MKKRATKTKINVRGTEIAVMRHGEEDFISLTDMVRNFDGGLALIEQWLKNKDTVLFLGVWEGLNNPNFKTPEFEGIRNEAGRNSFYLSAKKWADATGARGLIAKAGRYGGTFAHRDIAFEFGSWLSPEFKLYLIKEFQRLKEDENRRLSLDWNLNRTLAKISYRIQCRTRLNIGPILILQALKFANQTVLNVGLTQRESCGLRTLFVLNVFACHYVCEFETSIRMYRTRPPIFSPYFEHFKHSKYSRSAQL